MHLQSFGIVWMMELKIRVFQWSNTDVLNPKRKHAQEIMIGCNHQQLLLILIQKTGNLLFMEMTKNIYVLSESKLVNNGIGA